MARCASTSDVTRVLRYILRSALPLKRLRYDEAQLNSPWPVRRTDTCPKLRPGNGTTSRDTRAGRMILVTGASSGIGRATVRLLARRGHTVMAGVRKERDASELQSEGLQSLLLDVTSPESMSRALEIIRPLGLQALVNNAGIGLAGPVECTRIEDIRNQFEVNVFSQLALIQACLPLLRQSKGRIVNIGSIGDRITIPFGGALCASKTAFASFNDALRMELAPWGIRVSLVEPGSIATPAVEKTLGGAEAAIAGWTPEQSQRYGDMFRFFIRMGAERENRGSPPEVVAEAIYQALTADRPRSRYLSGKDAVPMSWLARLLPDWLLDKIRQKKTGLPTQFGSLN